MVSRCLNATENPTHSTPRRRAIGGDIGTYQLELYGVEQL